MNQRQKVTIFWKDSWYYLMDDGGDFLQLGSLPGTKTVFGGIRSAITRSSRMGIEYVAAQFDLQVVESWPEFLRGIGKRILFVVAVMFVFYGLLLTVLITGDKSTLPQVSTAGLLLTLGIFAGIGCYMIYRTDK